ncbi:MAG TPA: hypothetical protein VEK39_14050 [Solirubrobacterales bacterium]|nr:hypothetical protein [Solirubrobacterales bacterium]
MPDQQDVEPGVETSDLSTEIGASLASVWARYFGARPSKAETEYEGKVVRWVLADGTSEFDQGMAAEAEAGDAPLPVRTLPGYKRDTSAAVAKTTHRRVMAMISDHDAKTGIATETFILESPLRKY